MARARSTSPTAGSGQLCGKRNVLRGLGKTEFRLADVYAHAETLARLHPQNKNVEPKIRQQL